MNHGPTRRLASILARPTVATLAIATSLYLLTTCGCNAFYKVEDVEPEAGADLQDLRVLVVPFREESRWYGESATGKALASGLERVIRLNCGAEFLSSDERRAVLNDIIDSTDPTIPWTELARKHNLEAIVTGDIVHRSYGQQQIVGMVAGRMTVLVEIWRPEGNTFSQEFTETYPKDPEHGEIAPSFEQTRGEVEAKLLGLISKQLGDAMCGYEKTLE